MLSQSTALITHDTVYAQLTFDTLCRRRRAWPLLGERELDAMAGLLHGARIGPQLFYAQSWGRATADEGIKTQNVQGHLYRAFPALKMLFDMAPNNILVAGGSVVRAVHKGSHAPEQPARQNMYEWNGTDVDVFFYGVTHEAATLLLGQLVDALVEHSKSDGKTVTISRSKNQVEPSAACELRE